MATVKYTGARYITKFADPIEWQANTAYEQIVAVQFEGKSYISKMPVPKGIGNPKDNPNYWLLWAEPNAQFEELRQIVENYDESLNEIDARITSIESSKDNFVIFGDSWSAFNEGFSNWFSLANIEKILNVKLFNFAIGGSGFIVPAKPLSNQLNTAINTMAADERDNTKYVVIESGANDISAATNVASFYPDYMQTVRNFISSVEQSFQNAKIIYVPDLCATSYAGNAKKAQNANEVYRLLLDDLRWSNTSVTIPPNLPYFWVGQPESSVFRADLLHLNNNAARQFGKMILAACMNGTAMPYVKTFTSNGLKYTIDSLGNVTIHGAHTATTSQETITSEVPAAVKECLTAFFNITSGYVIGLGIDGAGNTAYIRYDGNNINIKGTSNTTYYF